MLNVKYKSAGNKELSKKDLDKFLIKLYINDESVEKLIH